VAEKIKNKKVQKNALLLAIPIRFLVPTAEYCSTDSSMYQADNVLERNSKYW
jgi:hypothetical protein